jgi:hypothetical protein
VHKRAPKILFIGKNIQGGEDLLVLKVERLRSSHEDPWYFFTLKYGEVAWGLTV